MNIKHAFAIIIFLISFVSSAQSIPTKTPIEPQATEQIEQTTPESQESRTYTQTDLTVITGNVQRPNAIIWFNNKLYVVCSGDWTIYEIDVETGVTITYIYGVRNGSAMYVEPGENGQPDLWVPDSGTNQLLRVNATRAPQSVLRNLDNPWGITFLDDDSFLITNSGGNTVEKVTRNGERQVLLTELRSPTGIASSDGFTYFANSGSARRAIEWFDNTMITDEGSSQIEVKPLVSGLQNTTNLVMASDGKLYFAYSLGTRGVVGRVDPTKCRDLGGCNNDEVEVVLYTELAAPLAGLSISPDMKLFVHTMFRPEIYWVQIQ